MKKWFTLNRVQKLVNMAGVQVVSFKPTRGDFTPGYRMNDKVRGVHLGFPNGVTLSVQWGRGNYCDSGLTCCEVMAMDEDGDPICIPNQLIPEHADQVIGHVDQEDLIMIMKECADITTKVKKSVAPVV